jgi:molybdopterin molybdotransferase
MLGIASDAEDSVIAGLQRGLDADMLVTSGGVSVGDYDIVRDVLAKEGEVVFWQVRLRPGKPLAFGVIKGGGGRKIPFFGLAGNPVSAMVNFELFVRPAMLKMMGRQRLTRPVIEAVIEEAIKNSDGRRIYARVVVEKRDGGYFARLTGSQSSGVLTSMTQANGLVIISEDRPSVKKGELVPVMMLDWGEEPEQF